MKHTGTILYDNGMVLPQEMAFLNIYPFYYE